MTSALPASCTRTMSDSDNEAVSSAADSEEYEQSEDASEEDSDSDASLLSEEDDEFVQKKVRKHGVASCLLQALYPDVKVCSQLHIIHPTYCLLLRRRKQQRSPQREVQRNQLQHLRPSQQAEGERRRQHLRKQPRHQLRQRRQLCASPALPSRLAAPQPSLP